MKAHDEMYLKNKYKGQLLGKGSKVILLCSIRGLSLGQEKKKKTDYFSVII